MESDEAWGDDPTAERAPPPDDPTEPDLRGGLPPRRIGAYHVKSMIDTGGMGTVYLAVQEQPRRTVALKVMKAGIASRSALRRFEYESQILARLRHPNIAQVYEAGTHDDGSGGVPFFAMEYVPGAMPLTEYAVAKKLGTRERLDLFAKVCDAVHHGHQKGIIHRDLKPSNILVDSTGEPKIIDFGVARATDSDLAVTTLQTDIGQLIGTVQYMSPEQFAADPHDLDTRSDVYALGVVLFEMLCEQLPYDVSRVAIHEAARVVREDEPAKPSTINRTLRGDVETITLKAMEKDRDRRYRSAEAFADDLRRYLGDEVIQARPPSTLYRARMFVRRNVVLVSAVTVVLAVMIGSMIVRQEWAVTLLMIALGLLMLGFIGTSWGLLRASTARREAVRQRNTAVSALSVAEKAELEAVAARGEEARHREHSDRAREEAVRAREEAERNRDDLGAVVEFQSEMLASVEPGQFGIGMRSTLLERLRTRIEASARDPEETERVMSTIREALGEINWTDFAGEITKVFFLDRAAESLERRFAERPLIEAEVRMTIAEVEESLGLLSAAEPHLCRALAIREGALGRDSPATLSSRSRLGALYARQGRLDEAMLNLREAVDGRRTVLGEDHADTIESMSAMAFLLWSRGDLAESEALWRDLRARCLRVFGDDHRSTFETIGNLAGVLIDRGQQAEAIPLFRGALEWRRGILGDDHPETLESMDNMGQLLRYLGRAAEAEPLCREALEGRRRLLGDEHPDTLITTNGMGYVLEDLGRLSEAETCFRAAFDGLTTVLGTSNIRTLNAVNNLARVLNGQSQYEAALQILPEHAPTIAGALGEGHWRSAEARSLLGEALAGQGQFQEAEPHLIDGHAGIVASAPPDRRDWAVRVAAERIVRLYEAWGRPDELVAWRQRVDEVAAVESAGETGSS